MNEVVLVIMAHPDDAEITMGGTLARFAMRGYEVHLLIASLPANGVVRSEEAYAAARVLGITCHILSKGDAWRVEDIPTHELVSDFDEWTHLVRPSLVFTHWHDDIHIDHRITARAVTAACRRQRVDLFMGGPSNLDVPFEAEFNPNTFVDVSDFYEIGLQAARVHSTQMRRGDYERFVDARTRFYGAQVGVLRADAFKCVKQCLR